MEQSYEARRENLRRRKKSQSSNDSGKFLSLPSEIVALRFLRILPLTTQPFTLPTRGEKRNLDPPFPPFHGSFLKMIVIYAIVSRDVLLKHLRCRSFLDLQCSQNIRASLLFGSGTRSLKGEGNLSLLALTSVNISRQRLNITGMRSDNALPRPVSLRLILTSRIFPRLVFPGFPNSSKPAL